MDSATTTTSASPPPPISCAAYARRRGCSTMAVSRAIARGRLVQSVVRDARGDPKITDPELADREWEASTDLSKAPGYVRERAEGISAPPSVAPPDAPPSAAVPPRPAPRVVPPPPEPEGEDPDAPPGLSLALESAREKHWKAKIAEQEFREREGELVEARMVELKLSGVYSQVRTKLLGVPSRARQALPHLTAGDVAVLEDLVREALEDLVEPEPEVGQPVEAAGQ